MTKHVTHFLHIGTGITLLLLLSLFLVSCGQDQAETGDPDVSEEAADVAQESEELAEAAGEELEQGAEQAGTAAAQTGEEIEQGAEQAGEEIEQGAEQAGTAVAQTGEEIEQGAEQAGEEIEQGAEQAGTAAAQTGEELQEETAGLLPQELTGVEGVTLSKLDDDLDEYVGQTVGVRGDIVETIGSNAFQLNDPSTLGGDEILVITDTLDRESISTGNTVDVSGMVYQFDDLAALESETGIDLQDELFDDWDADNAVLLAQEIINVAETESSY